jgi:hypothetical protein
MVFGTVLTSWPLRRALLRHTPVTWMLSVDARDAPIGVASGRARIFAEIERPRHERACISI